MTEADFRSNTGLIDYMRSRFSEAEMQSALIVLKDSAPVADALDSDPEIVSVRRLSRIDGYNECLLRLFALATPLPPPPVQLEETWGTDSPTGVS